MGYFLTVNPKEDNRGHSGYSSDFNAFFYQIVKQILEV